MVQTATKKQKTDEQRNAVGRKPVEPDTSTYRGRFGLRLRELRQRKFDTQGAFVDALLVQGLEVSQKAVSTWEHGTRTPPIEWLPMIAATLGVKPGALLPPE